MPFRWRRCLARLLGIADPEWLEEQALARGRHAGRQRALHECAAHGCFHCEEALRE